MKNTFPILLIFIFFLFPGCKKENLNIPEGEYTLEERYTMAFTNSGDFRIRIEEILYDSRSSDADGEVTGDLGFRMITSKGDVKQNPHILPASNTLLYTPVGIYRFKFLSATPSPQEVRSGTTERYKIRFSLTEE